MFPRSTGAAPSGAGRSRDFARAVSGETGVPDDLPEMPVGIAEVPGVDPPRTFVRLFGHCCARSPSLREQPVHIVPARHQVPDAELTRHRLSELEVRVLRELHPWVESERDSSFELEHRGSTRRRRLVTLELRADDAR